MQNSRGVGRAVEGGWQQRPTSSIRADRQSCRCHQPALGVTPPLGQGRLGPQATIADLIGGARKALLHLRHARCHQGTTGALGGQAAQGLLATLQVRLLAAGRRLLGRHGNGGRRCRRGCASGLGRGWRGGLLTTLLLVGPGRVRFARICLALIRFALIRRTP